MKTNCSHESNCEVGIMNSEWKIRIFDLLKNKAGFLFKCNSCGFKYKKNLDSPIYQEILDGFRNEDQTGKPVEVYKRVIEIEEFNRKKEILKNKIEQL